MIFSAGDSVLISAEQLSIKQDVLSKGGLYWLGFSAPIYGAVLIRAVDKS